MGNLQHTLVDLRVIEDGKLVDDFGHHQLEREVVSLDLTKLVVPFRRNVAERDAMLVCCGLESTLEGVVDLADDFEG